MEKSDIKLRLRKLPTAGKLNLMPTMLTLMEVTVDVGDPELRFLERPGVSSFAWQKRKPLFSARPQVPSIRDVR